MLFLKSFSFTFALARSGGPLSINFLYIVKLFNIFILLFYIHGSFFTSLVAPRFGDNLLMT